MRLNFYFCGCAVFLVFACLAGAASAAPTPATDSPSHVKAATTAIAPHRAIYTMSLGSIKNGSTVTDVSGRMLFEWRDVCDGWAIQQHMQLHFAHSDSADEDVTSTELTWESKDGRQYNFNIRRLSNGQETEHYHGKATLNADGSGQATYSAPAQKVMKLQPGTLFPSSHTALIIQKAGSDEKLFSRRVFDGADENGSSDISAIILPQQPVAAVADIDAHLKDNPLLAAPSWPVHMAFFDIKSETGEPDYEMDLDLAANGVARRMKIDYSDFSVLGKLEEIEPLPAAHCS